MWVVLTVVNVHKDTPCVRVLSVHPSEQAARDACTRPVHQIVRIDYD